jgi:uncharacterized protein YdhG (YjbR/CyaY superfamily)
MKGSVQEYLAKLPPDRREALSAVRKVILKNLPKGYVESVNWGMICYEIPLKRYPNTYNGRPLGLAGLASQKNHMSVHLMNVYGDPETEAWFKAEFAKSGKKLDMGKSCVRFRKLDDLPLELIGRAIARTPVARYIEFYERSRR